MLKSNFDYRDAYVLVIETIAVKNTETAAALTIKNMN